MNADITRRGFVRGIPLLAMSGSPVLAQDFAGMGKASSGYTAVKPGVSLGFPADLGAHPDFRLEWWYVTANLRDADGRSYGAQWTLFRQALAPGPQNDGWANQHIWMGHAAVTTPGEHRFSELLARGGIGQAGVELYPFRAWIDGWEMRSAAIFSSASISPIELTASASNFSYRLSLETNRAFVLQGDAGYSKKSERGQASYYFSQPWFGVTGAITLDDRSIPVSGQGWMDREWSSQPLAPDQTGWDWFSFHFETGAKLMVFRLRQSDGHHYAAANWIEETGRAQAFSAEMMSIIPTGHTIIGRRKLPTEWTIAIPSREFKIAVTPLNPRSWNELSFPYWEGPVSFQGSQRGVGYLEMTGY